MQALSVSALISKVAYPLSPHMGQGQFEIRKAKNRDNGGRRGFGIQWWHKVVWFGLALNPQVTKVCKELKRQNKENSETTRGGKEAARQRWNAATVA